MWKAPKKQIPYQIDICSDILRLRCIFGQGLKRDDVQTLANRRESKTGIRSERERETDKQTNREREREMCLSGGAGFLVKQFFEHV